MSELTPCNYCTLGNIRYRAEKQKLEVTTLPERGGIDVYVHPSNVEIKTLESGEREKYWRAWLMQLSDHCVC